MMLSQDFFKWHLTKCQQIWKTLDTYASNAAYDFFEIYSKLIECVVASWNQNQASSLDSLQR